MGNGYQLMREVRPRGHEVHLAWLLLGRTEGEEDLTEKMYMILHELVANT